MKLPLANNKKQIRFDNSMGECSTIQNTYRLYRHLELYCIHPSNCVFNFNSTFGTVFDNSMGECNTILSDYTL